MTVAIVEVKVQRAEGPSSDCGIMHVYPSLSEANAKLKQWSLTAPKNGGYDKCDFFVKWADGVEYSGCYDLKHFSVDTPNIGAQMEGFFEFLTGEHRPAHFRTEDEYQALLNGYGPTIRADAKHMLATHALS